MKAIVIGGLVMGLLVLVACGSGEIKPVELDAFDTCAHCKMALSGREFVAEFITEDGDALKFDDIGCSVGYLKEKPGTKVAGYFVNDYELKSWIRGKDAVFVRSTEIASPMSGGLIAFGERPRADAAAIRFKGAVVSFDEVYRR